MVEKCIPLCAVLKKQNKENYVGVIDSYIPPHSRIDKRYTL